MCLRIAIQYPNAIIETGVLFDREYVITHNGLGYRCGYVRVEPGHPWHGKSTDDFYDMPISVHGRVSFAEADMACEKAGPDDAWWIGFDCAHGFDAPDFELPWDDEQYKGIARESSSRMDRLINSLIMPLRRTVKDTEYVRTECAALAFQVREQLTGAH